MTKKRFTEIDDLGLSIFSAVPYLVLGEAIPQAFYQAGLYLQDYICIYKKKMY